MRYLFAAFTVSTLIAASASAQEFYPREAGSWGGKVRNGPGTEYSHIGGLQEGDPVTLLYRTDTYMGEYPWFRIRFKNGQEGFKWGGILCSFDRPIPGIYQQCTKDNRHASNNNQDQSGGTSTSPLDFPLPAASGGGVVRSGPGVDFPKIASTTQFEPITVEGTTGVFMNGYPWFTISFRGGRQGYQWGGIICSTDRPFSGTFDTCENFRRSLAGNSNQDQTQNSGQRQVEYTCDGQVPMSVIFIDEPARSFAKYSHDSGPMIEVSIQRTGSGFHYSNGYHELRGKGRQIDLIEGGSVLTRCSAD